MFIKWLSRRIVTDRPAELFAVYDDIPTHDQDGRVVRTSRRKRVPTLDDPPWKPLYCRHRGAGRIASTPILVRAERMDGKPRQRLLHRFATIRSCCIGEPFLVAAWWYDFEWWCACQEQGEPGLVSRLLGCMKQPIVRKLREVVSEPTSQGVEEFTIYLLRKEAEQRQAREAMRESMRRAEEQRRQADESARRAREAEQERLQREQTTRRVREEEEFIRRSKEDFARIFAPLWEQLERLRRGAEVGGPAWAEPWWLVLEFDYPPASAEQVRAKYRKLVMQHHPDRGGDPEMCKKLNAAFVDAKRHFGNRW